jgi:class 3 adenylate cyclase
MKINPRLKRHIISALSQSSVHSMQRLARMAIPGYDLHQRSGFPETIDVPKVDAAEQIILDMVQEGMLKEFIELLIKVDRDGLMGRPVPLPTLPQIIKEMTDMGFTFNAEYGVFVESDQRGRTKSWGVLREGQNYELAFLSLDIVGNSTLVRKYSEAIVANAYGDLKSIVSRIVAKRNGRIWNWEGDGGLIAFYFDNKNTYATLAGMEILLDLFMYNLMESPFPRDKLKLRIAAHTGPCQFSNNIRSVQSTTLQRLYQIESKLAGPDAFTLSPNVYTDLGTKLGRFFKPTTVKGSQLYYYRLSWEK